MAHPFHKIRQNNVSRRRVSELTSAYANGTDLLSDESPVARVRADRPMRAAGGRVGKAPVTVNVITQAAPKPEAPPMMMPPPPPPGPPPGGPPGMGGPPPMPPGGGVGGPPPGGMPPPMMRARGGKVVSDASQGATKVQHSPAHMEVGKLNRPRVVTFATGGGVISFKTRGGPKLPGGAGGGKGRLKKTAMTHKGSQV